MRILKNKDFWIFLVLALTAGYGVKALLIPEFYTSHDGPTHLSRLAQYITLLKDGQFPPRWSASLNGTLGYPIFVFSYHLPFALSGLFYFAGMSLGQSLELVFGLTYILSGIGAYLWLKVRHSRLASVLGALFFLYAPYRFSLIFVRAAIGEAMALAILPWILWSMEKIALSKQKKWWSVTGLLIFLAMVSHSLFLPMYLPIIVVYGLWIMYRERKNLLLPFVSSVSVALLLSAFYLLPLIFERQYIVFDTNYQRHGAEHLVTAWQLIRSPWGYGFSFPDSENDAMSFQVGLTQILVVIIGLIFMLIGKKKQLKPEYIVAVALFFGACFVMLESSWSKWLWMKMPGMGVIDFPWRFLGLSTLAASWIATLVVESVEKRTIKYVLVAGLAVLVLVANRNHVRINLPYQVDTRQVFEDSGTTTVADEYLPIWRKSSKHDRIGNRVEVLHEKQKLRITESSSNKIGFKTDFVTPQTVYVNSLYFPGWHAYVREGLSWQELILGEGLQIVDQAWGAHELQAVSGTMKIEAPAGPQEYFLAFGETSLRKTGNVITVMTLVGLILFTIWQPRADTNA